MPSFNPGPLEAEAGGSLKFKASLVYRASSRAMQKTNKQTNKTKQKTHETASFPPNCGSPSKPSYCMGN